MKKIGLVFILACGWQTAAYAQQTLQVDVLKVGGSSKEADRKKSGIEIGDGQRIRIGEWENTAKLSFAADGYNFTGGNVGIGTTDPKYKLDVDGSIHATSVFFDWVVAATGDIGWVSVNDALIEGTLTARGVASIATLHGERAQFDSLRVFQNAVLQNAYISGDFSAQKAYIYDCSAQNALVGDLSAYNATIYGTISAQAISVTPTGGADFVFNNDYHLKPLSEVKHFIKENKHLPEIPSAAEMTSEGVDLGEMQMKLLQKTEELTLYMIQQQETIEKQQKLIEALTAKIEKLENK